MNRMTLIAPLALGLSAVSFAAFAQTTAPAPAAAPATEAAPAVVGFTAPEGYSLLPDWKTVTADQLKGAEVYHAVDGAKVGDISDIVLSADNGVSGVVIDVGGFLGMGVHSVSLGADQISLYSNEGKIIAATNLDKDALKALPAYEAPAN